MSLRTALRLGRVSNLPTVWTNALAGVVLATGHAEPRTTAMLAVSFSLFYVGGMYLNDAFDRKIDALERPERPIPSGEVATAWVFGAGFGFLLAAICILTAVGINSGHVLQALIAGLLLAAAVVYYDANHKGNILSPFIMGLCRALIYLGAAFALSGRVGTEVSMAAGLLLCYVAGLTYVARRETQSEPGRPWPFLLLFSPVVYLAFAHPAQGLVPPFFALFTIAVVYGLVQMKREQDNAVQRAVAVMIAAISLLDATFVASHGGVAIACLAVAAFPMTRLMQRYVPGT